MQEGRSKAKAQPLDFTIGVEDFNPFLLPEDTGGVGTESFKEAVTAYYTEQYAPIGGNTIVEVGDESIHVWWVPDAVAQDPFGYALDLLQGGELAAAVPLLETFLAADPDDVDTLYNLGMAQSDLGNLHEAKRHLSHLVDLNPKHSNALVALGVAHQRDGETKEAIDFLERAITVDPKNGYAHRNLGAVLGKSGRPDDAEEHLRSAYQLLPQDQASVFGLAQCLEQSSNENDLAEADQLYTKAIEINPQSQIAELARRARSGFAEQSFRGATGGALRPDAVMYCLSALEKFAKMKPGERQGVVFEIAMLGTRGLDTNDPTPKYKLRSLPGNYTGLQLVSMMYVGFKQIEPGMDTGFDLSKEYAAAQELFSARGK